MEQATNDGAVMLREVHSCPTQGTTWDCQSFPKLFPNFRYCEAVRGAYDRATLSDFEKGEREREQCSLILFSQLWELRHKNHVK